MCLRVEGGRGVRVLIIFFLKLGDLRGVAVAVGGGSVLT